MNKLLLICSFILLFGNAYPKQKMHKNNVLYLKVLAQLGLKEKDINEELYAEKVLPNAKSNTVMVFPKYRKNETDADRNRYFELDAYIVIADNLTGKILYKYIEENAWTSDAMVLSDIGIDTGIYNLNGQTRAFGVRVNYTGSSHANPFNQTALSLFIRKGKSIAKVLENYPISEFHGEWDTNCAGEFEDIDGVIDLDKIKTNGFGNLIIKETIVKTKNVPKGDDCIEKKSTSYKTKRLKYNGVEYK